MAQLTPCPALLAALLLLLPVVLAGPSTNCSFDPPELSCVVRQLHKEPN